MSRLIETKSAMRSDVDRRASSRGASDEALAIRIRSEGRRALEAGECVALADYLGSVPDLPRRPAPFDAAIDIALRSLSGSSLPDPEAVAALVDAHPEHEEAIRTAAFLGEALWRTQEVGPGEGAPPTRALPASLGAEMDDGRRRYELLEHVGSGSSGAVYRGIDHLLSDGARSASVAVKILHATRDDPISRQRFIDEASKARRLDHPNIVRVFDRGESLEGEPYIVYEFVGAGDLRAWIERREQPLPTREAASLVVRIARAVNAAHARGLVHLDLKPANILMTDAGEPKVADFGLSLRRDAHEHDDDELDALGAGTCAFMAPEQFHAEDDAASPQADVFALGGMLHYLLTGGLPSGDTLDEIRETHAQREPRRPALDRARGGGRVDRDLDLICRRALANDRGRRHAGAGELADDLDAWLRHEPIRWTRPGPARVAALFAKRRPATLALLIAVTTALAGAAGASETARRFAADAAEQRLEAAVQAERVEAERRWKADVAERMTALMRDLARARRSGLAGEVLTSLWMLEWVHGPTLLREPERLEHAWSARIDIVRGLLDERRREGGPASLEALQLESMLAFWLIKRGEVDEPRMLLAHNLDAWRNRLDPDDPWLEDLDALRLCVEANAFSIEERAAPLEGPRRTEAIDLERALRAHATRLRDRGDGAQLRLLIFERLRSLYAPTALASDPWLEWADESIDALDISGAR